VLVPGANAWVPLARPEAREQVELLAETHVHAAKARPDRGGDGPLDGHAVGADGVEDLIGQGRAMRVHHVGPRLLEVPVETDPGRFQDPAGGLGQLRPHAVARDESYAVRQAVTAPR